MNINLYPYNYYILLGSIILVALCLCILLGHFIKLSKTLVSEEENVKNINNLITAAKYKKDALEKTKKESSKNNKYYKIAMPILLAIYNTYRNDSELKGAKGYTKAAKKVIKKDITSNPMKFIRQFM